MKTAFIIGVTGQDGAYLCKLLLEKGYKTIGVTRNVSNISTTGLAYLGITREIQFVEQPSFELNSIARLIKEHQPDEIYNLAAQSSVSASFTDPFGTVNFNILSVLSWLQAIKEHSPTTRFYQASSSEMFGNVRPLDLPLKESLIFRPASPYGISKAAAHWLTVNYREAYNLFCSCGILFNHESCLRGSNYVVKKIVNAAVRIKMGLDDEPVRVGNTSIKRDWGYAPFYVEAMWRVLQCEKPDDFLICSGNVISLDDLIDLVMKELQLDKHRYIQTDKSLFRPVDLEEIYGDNSKAKRELNWYYDMTNDDLVKQLIKDEFDFVEWQRRNLSE